MTNEISAEPTNRTTKSRRIAYVRMPGYLLLIIFLAMTAYTAASMYWIVKKDNQLEKYRRMEIELQNEIKEREQMLQQNRQKLEQLGKRLEIFEAIQQISSSDVTVEQRRSIATLVHQQSEKYGIDPFLLLSVMAAESSLRPWAQSHAGARGLMQLMPNTGRHLAELVKQDPTLIGHDGAELAADMNVNSIESNIQLGTLYLTKLMLRYENLREAIYAYNLGPSLYESRKKSGGPFPQQYYSKIMNTYRQLLEARDDRRQSPLPKAYTVNGPHETLLAQAEAAR